MRAKWRLPQFWVASIPPLLTMFASGLWHGAGWTYVAWGLYYGVLIVLYQALGIRGNWKPRAGWRRGSAWLVMFLLIVFGWAIFRAPSLGWLAKVLFSTPLIKSQADSMVALVTLSTTIFYSMPLFIKWGLDRFSREGWLQAAYFAAASAVILMYLNSAAPDFIYFQF